MSAPSSSAASGPARRCQVWPGGSSRPYHISCRLSLSLISLMGVFPGRVLMGIGPEARFQQFGLGVDSGKTRKAEWSEIYRRPAGRDLAGERLSDNRRGSETADVATSGNKESPQVGSLVDDEVSIRCHRGQTPSELQHPGSLESGKHGREVSNHASHRLKIQLEVANLEVCRQGTHVHLPRVWF